MAWTLGWGSAEATAAAVGGARGGCEACTHAPVRFFATCAHLARVVAAGAEEAAEGGDGRCSDRKEGGHRLGAVARSRAALGGACARIQAHGRASGEGRWGRRGPSSSFWGDCTPLAIAQRPAMKSHNLRGGGRHQDRLHGAQRPSLDAALASPGFAEPTCQSDYEHWPCWSGAWLARQARSVPGSIGWLRPSIRRAAQRSRRRIPPQGMGRARRIFPNGACPPKATAAPSPLRSQSLHRAVETKSSRQLRLLPSMLVPDLS